MRTRTFVLSFFVHVCVIGMAAAVRIVATTELPDPPRTPTTFMAANVETPEVPAPAAAARRGSTTASVPTVNPDMAPLTEPTSISPESLEPFDLPPASGGGLPGAGDPLGDPFGDPFGPPPRPTQRTVAPAVPQPPVRPGGVVKPPQKIHHVAPNYPAIAQAAKVSGTVILEALIAEDGSVREVKVLKSVTLLDAAAVDAVRQWRFTPTLLNGAPVQVIMSVTVTFTLH